MTVTNGLCSLQQIYPLIENKDADPVHVSAGDHIHISIHIEYQPVQCRPYYRQVQYRPLLPELYLAHIATLCLKYVWEWHIPEESQAVIDLAFNQAAYSVRPFWHFIFAVATQFGAIQFGATTRHKSWAMRNFLFGIGHFQRAKMERIVSTFTKAFGQCLTIKEATSWLQEIIQKSRRQIEFSSTVLPDATIPVYIDYLMFLKRGRHEKRLEIWYKNGGAAAGKRSIRKLHMMKLFMVPANPCDSSRVFQYVTEATCALDVGESDGPDGIITEDLRELFSDCIAYIYAHVCYLQKDKKQFLITEIEKYDTYAQLPITREHALRARIFKLLEEGKLEW